MTAPERRTPSSRVAQPAPRSDDNLKRVHRKIDRNLKSGVGLVDNAPRIDRRTGRAVLPGAPSLMARAAQQGGVATVAAGVAEATGAPVDEDDFLARAREERMVKQWEDVTTRLCRDFAPDGGADQEIVLGHIAEQRRVLDSATVRDYLPVLVERAVRRLLDPEEAANDQPSG
ncbi:hypothetical protein WEH80_27330 [Actinomycetes bacterium KLBMP 9759]